MREVLDPTDDPPTRRLHRRRRVYSAAAVPPDPESGQHHSASITRLSAVRLWPGDTSKLPGEAGCVRERWCIILHVSFLLVSPATESRALPSREKGRHLWPTRKSLLRGRRAGGRARTYPPAPPWHQTSVRAFVRQNTGPAPADAAPSIRAMSGSNSRAEGRGRRWIRGCQRE